MKSKIERMIDELAEYEDGLSLEDNIKDRLDKTLNLYMEELSNASDRILGKKSSSVYKELSK